MYKLNDNVVVTKKALSTHPYHSVITAVYGKKGKVIEIDDGDGYILVEFKKQWHNLLHRGGKVVQGSGNCWYFKKNGLKLKNKKTTIGSKVIVTKTHSDTTIGNLLVGKTGIVTKRFLYGNKKWLTVKFEENYGNELHDGEMGNDENVYWHIRPKHLKLVK